MKIISTLVLSCICIIGFSQTTKNAQVYLDFEDNVVIPSDVSGVTTENGSVPITAKLIKDGAFTTFDAVDNELRTDGGENVYFMDYDGYIKFDETILNSNKFSLAMDYKWTGNYVWYIGIFSLVGYDNVNGWQSKQLVFKNYANGQMDGFGLTAASSDLRIDTYGHFVFTYDEGVTKVYVNGVLLATSTADQTIHNLSDVSLYVGAKLAVDASTGVVSPSLGSGKSKSTQQNVDNVALFDYVLTASEVSTFYDMPTAINNDINIVDVEVYPNPLSEKLFVSSPEAVYIEIYNIGGVKVMSSADTVGGVDVSSLPKGVYVVKCLGTGGVMLTTQKVIKK